MTTLNKISILALGSRGDVQPYIAIALSLKNSGYNVTILTSTNFKSFITSFGLKCSPIYNDYEKLMAQSPVFKEAMSKGDTLTFMTEVLHMKDTIQQGVGAFLQQMEEDPPQLLICCFVGLYYGNYALRVLHVPTLFVFLQGIVFDSERPIWGLPNLPRKEHCQFLTLLEKISNWDMFDDCMQSLTRPKLLQYYPQEQFIKDWEYPPLPVVICQSPIFKQLIYKNAHPNLHFVGASVIKANQQIQYINNFGGLDNMKIIERFIDKEPSRKPIYCGWGSMVCKSPEYMVHFIVKALQISQQRGIVLGGWAKLSLETLKLSSLSDLNLISYAEENLLFVDEAPHEYLFPLTACTIHHGGSGTTNTALRAGVPTIITPIFLDQFDHSHLINKLGTGIGFSTQLQKISSNELARSITFVLSDSNMILRAREIGDILCKENGPSGAVSEVKSFWDAFHKSES